MYNNVSHLRAFNEQIPWNDLIRLTDLSRDFVYKVISREMEDIRGAFPDST